MTLHPRLRSRVARLAALAALVAGLAVPAAAQTSTKSTFVRIASQAAVLYEPTTPGPKAGLGIFLMHDNGDSLTHIAATNLAQRGFRVLAANARYAPDAEDHDTDWDKALADVKAGVAWLRANGATQVVLVGHSSGAPLMAWYQNIAENGVKACQGAEKIVPCPDSLGGGTPADGVVLLDPIFGTGANVLASVDPAVVVEGRPRQPSPRLDMYNPANGFSPTGAHYPESFKSQFLHRQAERNNGLINDALARLRSIQLGEGRFVDDEPFMVPGATRVPKLWRPDLGLLAHTVSPHTLLTPAGPVTQVITSVRVPSGTEPNTQLLTGALNTSVKRFLSTFATRATSHYRVTESGVTGIDWASSYNNTPAGVAGLKAPLLVMGMTGHYWIVSAEIVFNAATSADKSVAFVEGAAHGMTPCTACEQTPGQFGDTAKRTFDHVAAWLNARY